MSDSYHSLRYSFLSETFSFNCNISSSRDRSQTWWNTEDLWFLIVSELYFAIHTLFSASIYRNLNVVECVSILDHRVSLFVNHTWTVTYDLSFTHDSSICENSFIKNTYSIISSQINKVFSCNSALSQTIIRTRYR